MSSARGSPLCHLVLLSGTRGGSGWRPRCSQRLGSFSEGIKGKRVSGSLALWLGWFLGDGGGSEFSHFQSLRLSGQFIPSWETAPSGEVWRAKHILPVTTAQSRALATAWHGEYSVLGMTQSWAGQKGFMSPTATVCLLPAPLGCGSPL